MQVPVLPRSLITMDVGCAGVSVLLTKSLLADRDTRALGVTVQEQHEISCSSGENVYTLAQMLPPVAPELVILIIESPICRFDA